jgi:FKBP-type peptidyl-prolyl cis-trans isomerase
MEVGEKRQLIVPPDLAYGPNGRGDKIPPNSTLVFDIEMIGIRRG